MYTPLCPPSPGSAGQVALHCDDKQPWVAQRKMALSSRGMASRVASSGSAYNQQPIVTGASSNIRRAVSLGRWAQPALARVPALQQQRVATSAASSSNSASQTGPSQRPAAKLPVVPPLSSVSVPHCGYHFDGSDRRFFEGWYWKVQIPECNDSFALIFSIEVRVCSSKLALHGMDMHACLRKHAF